MNPTVSVAMCTYNGSRFLREQLESIAAQSRRPDELVVFDDVSRDDTRSILKAFADHSEFPVRLFANKERLGAARNFQQAIQACEGEIIVLSDQDDVWRPHKLMSVVEAFRQHPDAVYAFSDAAMVDQSGKPLGQTFWEVVRLRQSIDAFSGARQVEILLRHNLIPGAALAFRASFREKLLPLPEGWMHDYWIVLLGSILGSGTAVNEVLLDYRSHAAQVCGWGKKSFAQICKDSFGSSSDDSWKKLESFRQVLDRVAAFSPSTSSFRERVRLLEEKEAHLLRRAQARSSSGVSRIGQVIREATTGRYRRFSNSWYSMIRDL
jgi:glycosyltransferase involved in cell wall biosynthesis